MFLQLPKRTPEKYVRHLEDAVTRLHDLYYGLTRQMVNLQEYNKELEAANEQLRQEVQERQINRSLYS